MLPLPETDPNRMMPSALGQQSRRVSTIEPGSLPTPRSYRVHVPGVIGSVTSGDITLGQLPVFLQPHETVGIMITVDIRSSAASTGVVVNHNSDYGDVPFQDTQLLNQASVHQHASTFATYGSWGTSQTGTLLTVTFGTNFLSGFRWLLPFRRADNNVVQVPSTGDRYNLGFGAWRIGGTGTVTFAEFRAWALVL